MKTKLLLGLVLLAGGVASVSAMPAQKLIRPAAPAKISGDYVEARTASVFCGACHYNGELVTTGHDAIMAWSFTGGQYNGVDLAGVRVAASVTSPENLGDERAPHKAQLIIDSHASAAQTAAAIALLKAKCGKELGEIASIGRAPVSFIHNDRGYTVDAAGFASMNVSYRTDNSCCVQPHLVWYEPLSPIQGRMVGYTEIASYSGNVGDHWSRQGEDSAFYGSISF